MLDPHFIHHAFALPAFLAFLLILPVLHPRLPTSIARILPHVALALPILVAWSHVFGTPLFPPRSLINWLFYFCILACILDILATLITCSWLRYLLATLALSILIYLLCRPKIDFHWSLSLSVLLFALLAILCALLYLSFEYLARHTRTLTTHLIATALIMTATLCLALATGRFAAQPLVLPTATLLVILPFTRRLSYAPGPLLLFTILPIPPLLTAALYSDLSPAISCLLICAPMLASLTDRLSRRVPPRRRFLSITLAIAAPLIAAITLSILAYTNRGP